MAIDRALLQFERAAGDELADILALDVLHRDVKNAVRLVKIVDRADVRVVELGAELSFAFEAFEVCGLLSELRREDLDDDSAVELGVEGLIDRALAARADLFENLVLVDLRTNHKRMRHTDTRFEVPYEANGNPKLIATMELYSAD